MAKLYIATVVVCSAFAIGTLINPCQRGYRSFRDTLQKHRREGRVLSNSTVSLPRQFVFTKMQCLEICLRNPLCDGFEMRQKVNNEKNMWACKIYRISNSSEKKQETNAGLKNWIHYNISFLELQKILLKAPKGSCWRKWPPLPSFCHLASFTPQERNHHTFKSDRSTILVMSGNKSDRC